MVNKPWQISLFFVFVTVGSLDCAQTAIGLSRVSATDQQKCFC